MSPFFWDSPLDTGPDGDITFILGIHPLTCGPDGNISLIFGIYF